MLSGKKLKVVTVYKDFNLHIPLVVALDQAWEHSSSPKFVKNTQTES
jgi:hypothetical protein